MGDQARTGIYQCDPSVFAPEGDKFPIIHVKSGVSRNLRSPMSLIFQETQ